jgi:regulation of enolase protein 1 (concanavalin A-like superfamily)
MSWTPFFERPDPVWQHEPRRWSRHGLDGLTLDVEPDTDYWQRTHYGFRRDNGHFLGVRFEGDVDLCTGVDTAPIAQYDQAGLMVRVSADCWLKTSIEFEGDRPSRLGAVVTNDGWSDWSTQDVPAALTRVWLRIQRRGSDFTVAWRAHEDAPWSQLRIARLGAAAGVGPVSIGPYACAPQGPGFAARFFGLGLYDPSETG